MSKQSATSPNPPPRRLPRGPLIVILLILAVMAWVFWLTRSTPRPPPDIPPLRELPINSSPDTPQVPATTPR